jgi:hypothetical protein
MENTTNTPNFKSCAMLLVLILTMFAGCYFILNSGSDCIRTLPDGAIRCECDFKSNDEWDKFKENTKGSWESVSMDTDPCKK